MCGLFGSLFLGLLMLVMFAVVAVAFALAAHTIRELWLRDWQDTTRVREQRRAPSQGLLPILLTQRETEQ